MHLSRPGFAWGGIGVAASGNINPKKTTASMVSVLFRPRTSLSFPQTSAPIAAPTSSPASTTANRTSRTAFMLS